MQKAYEFFIRVPEKFSSTPDKGEIFLFMLSRPVPGGGHFLRG